MKRVLLIGATLAACSNQAGEPSGIGKYRFGHTTLGTVKDGRCQPEKLGDGRQGTWCFALTPYKLANRNAEVAAYFLGTGDDAPIIELQLTVRGCVENDLERWLRANYGAPIEQKGVYEYWKNSFMWISAAMPSEPGRCLIRFLPLTEQGEIARIKAENEAPAKPQ